MKRFMWTWILIECVLLAAAPAAQAYDAYKPNVADLDKPNPADNSCWLASAANVLGSSGWGDTNTIYNTLMGHFVDGQGVVPPGWSSLAVNWWLMNNGLNPASPDYNPGVTQYTDVTIINRRLTNVDYDFLLDELTDCQYVNVSFEIPGMSIGHEMTLVGGNKSAPVPPPPQISVWHDNQGDLVAPPGDDDEYPNTWPFGFWSLDRQIDGNPENDWEAQLATLLCPGLQKPDEAMRNYDVAWYMDMDPATLNLVPEFRSAGDNYGLYKLPGGSTEPEWIIGADAAMLELPNQLMPDPWYKEIWLLVDFIDRGHQGDPGIDIIADGVTYDPTEVLWSDDGGQVRLKWVLPNQPDHETLSFPNLDYYNLYDISANSGSLVKDWDIATLCVPEPTVLALLLAGSAALARRRRR